MIVLANITVGIDVVAIVTLGGVVVTALVSVRMLGPNRRKVIEETAKLVEDTAASKTTRAINALETALTRSEADNTRLRVDFDELEERLDSCLDRLRVVTAERDQFAARLERMSRQLADAGITPVI